MMQKQSIYKLVLSGALVAIGVLLPLVTAHGLGVPGTLLLPMHIPVLLLGLLTGPQYGAIGGLLIPVLSSVFTGMPPVFPMLPIMSGELFAYGLISGLTFRKLKLPIYPSMIIAMISGRIVYGLIFNALLLANHSALKALTVTGAIIQGVPGIILQLLLIPVLVKIAQRTMPPKFTSLPKKTADTSLSFTEALGMIDNKTATCIIIKNDAIIHTAEGAGIKPLLELYEKHPEILKGAFVVDRIIGKAAAMIAELGGARKVYGAIMSESGRSYLQSRNIEAEYGRCVDIISNRKKDGICPLEKSVLELDDALEGYNRLKETIAVLMKAG